MENRKAKIGDYVTSEGPRGIRQGVFVKDNGDGTVVVEGRGETYENQIGPGGVKGLAVIPDENVQSDPQAWRHLLQVRSRLRTQS